MKIKPTGLDHGDHDGNQLRHILGIVRDTRRRINQMASDAPLGIAALMILLVAAWAPATAAPIRLGIPSKNLNTMPVYLAEVRSLYKKHGVEVEIIHVRGGSRMTKALIARKVDVMYNGPIATMKAMQKGAKIRFIMAPTIRNDYLLVAQTSVKSVADLVGRSVGISRPGAISYIMPRIIIQQAGVDPDQVKYVPIGTSGPRQKALVAGKIEAAVMHIESALKATSRPNLHVIGSIAKAMPQYPFFYLSAHNDLITDRQQEVVGLVAALIEANRIAIRDKAAILAVAKEQMSLEDEFLSRGYDYLIEIGAYSVNGGLSKDTYDLVHGIATQYKQITKELPADQFLTLDVQNAALQRVGRQ